MKTLNMNIDIKTLIKFMVLVTVMIMIPKDQVYAFSKLKNGFETITSTYLVPLAYAVAGASLIFYLIMAYFNQQDYQKKAASVFGITICIAVGADVLKVVQQTFS